MKIVKLEKELWWTNSFRTCEVLPLYMRLSICAFYMIRVAYLCIRGIPIEVSLKYQSSEGKVND